MYVCVFFVCLLVGHWLLLADGCRSWRVRLLPVEPSCGVWSWLFSVGACLEVAWQSEPDLVFGVVSVASAFAYVLVLLEVQHEEAPSEDMQTLPGSVAKQASVTIMMRTALFPFDRARLRNTTPSPIPVFQALSTAFREVLANHRFVLPTMDEVVSRVVL